MASPSWNRMSTAVGAHFICPVTTAHCVSSQELVTGELSEIRAYKLGKRRWSYNQSELLLRQEGTMLSSHGDVTDSLGVSKATYVKEDSSNEDSSIGQIAYRLQLDNGCYVQALLYLVYSEPCDQGTTVPSAAEATSTAEYQWELVSRGACTKGCQGPLLQTVRRYGALGCRFTGPTAKTQLEGGTAKKKQNRYMYFAIDEAGNHVGSKRFRLVAAVFDESTQELLGTACSLPIRVLANNDIPHGAAHIQLVVTIRQDWAGWKHASPRPLSVCLWPPTDATNQQTSTTEMEYDSLESGIQSSRPENYELGTLESSLPSNCLQPILYSDAPTRTTGVSIAVQHDKQLPTTPLVEQMAGPSHADDLLLNREDFEYDQRQQPYHLAADLTGCHQSLVLDHSLDGARHSQQATVPATVALGKGGSSFQQLLIGSEDLDDVPGGDMQIFTSSCLNLCTQDIDSRDLCQVLDEAAWELDCRPGLSLLAAAEISEPQGSQASGRVDTDSVASSVCSSVHFGKILVPLSFHPCPGGERGFGEDTTSPVPHITSPVVPVYADELAGTSTSSPSKAQIARSGRNNCLKRSAGCFVEFPKGGSGPQSPDNQQSIRAKLRRSLRRGFLSPCLKEAVNYDLVETQSHQANVGIRQASCISGLVHDTEAQATQLKCKADKLYQQLISSRMEVAWLRTRVHQLQQSQFVRSSEAAREVAGLSAQHCAQRFPLEHLRNCSNF